MTIKNEIALRPRFKLELDRNNEKVLNAFEQTKRNQNSFIVSRIDDHVFIKISKSNQHFWSPQLHLEVLEIDNVKCQIFGLFGPNPTVWSLFMFLHFIVAGLFLGFGIWAYTNWKLNTDFALQLFVSLFMVLGWIGLYIVGRLGKATGKAQMHELNTFMKVTLML